MLTLYQIFHAGVTWNPQIFPYEMASVFVDIGHSDEARIQQLRVDTRMMLPQMSDANYSHSLEVNIHLESCFHPVTPCLSDQKDYHMERVFCGVVMNHRLYIFMENLPLNILLLSTLKVTYKLNSLNCLVKIFAGG